MSGGVDSAVAALLIKESGSECAGATMTLFPPGGPKRESAACLTSQGAEDARAVAAGLGIPFLIFDMSEEFRRDVVERFITSYRSGATPNPCVECNRFLKFGKFLDRAAEAGYCEIATGHYAKIERDPLSGRMLLKKGADEKKDQSYFLYSLTQQQLSRTKFPLGSLTKDEVREIAEAHRLTVAQKHESQDICFVPDGDYAAFIERYTGERDKEGDFVDAEGKIIGRHRGITKYTIGQRKGLGLSLPEPLYVRAKDPAQNKITLCRNEELFKKTLTVKEVNLIACTGLDAPLRVKVKVRYKHQEQPATIEQIDETRIRLEFDAPQRAITPGQAAVFYDGDAVIGGGTIE